MKQLPPLGVQSWCFRNFTDNAAVAAKVRELGLTRIELCGVHADFQKPETMAAVADTYRQAGVSVVSIGVENLVGDPKERNLFESARNLGASHISVHFKVDSFARAIAQARGLSREFGIKVGIHCHGGYMFGGQPDVMDHLLALGAPEVGVNMDTAWCLQIGPWGGNPVEWAKKYGKSLHALHAKDFAFDRRGQWTDTIIGEGNLDLKGLVDVLRENGFDGVPILEYEGDADNPVPALARCVHAWNAAIGA